MGAISDNVEARAKALGWFSVALGLAELGATEQILQSLAVRSDRQSKSLVRAYGVRELLAGVGILSQPRQPGWLLARTVGDVLDLTTLALAPTLKGAPLGRTAAAMASIAGITVVDTVTSWQLRKKESRRQQLSAKPARKAITACCQPAEAYAIWRHFTRWPEFMGQVKSIEQVEKDRYRWTVTGPAGTEVSWVVKLTEDMPNKRLAWRSEEGAPIEHIGSVNFCDAPGGQGTEIRVELRLQESSFSGIVRAGVGELLGIDLHRFKQLVELGEVAHSDASVKPPLTSAQPQGELS